MLHKLQIMDALFIVIISFGLTRFLIPKMISFSHNWSLTDKPGGRKKQSSPVALLGGVPFIIVLFILIFIFYQCIEYNIIPLLFSFFLIFFTGFIDDIIKSKNKNFSILVRLAFYYLGAIIFSINCFKINGIFITAYFIKFSTITSFILSSFWLTTLINIINFSDGNDGLASGYLLSISSTLFIIGLTENNSFILLITTIVFGVNLSFITFNWFPAKIYMGDCGSSLLGFLIGIVELYIFLRYISLKNIVCLTILMAIPIFDTLRVIFIRIKNKKAIYKADRNHIHFILIDSGVSVWKTSIILILTQILLSFLSLFLYFL